jgi:hypothetical protein
MGKIPKEGGAQQEEEAVEAEVEEGLEGVEPHIY